MQKIDEKILLEYNGKFVDKYLERLRTYCRHSTPNLFNGCYHHNVLRGGWGVHCQPLWGVCKENGTPAPPLTVWPFTSWLRGSFRHISWIRLLPSWNPTSPPQCATHLTFNLGRRAWVRMRKRYQKTWWRWRLDFLSRHSSQHRWCTSAVSWTSYLGGVIFVPEVHISCFINPHN